MGIRLRGAISGSFKSVQLLKITIPIGILIALFGVTLMLQARSPKEDPFASVTRHEVTPKMEKISGSWARRTAPTFSTKDAAGQPLQLAQALAHGPVFLYFIKDGCPCSIDAQPLFNHLRDKFKGKVSFVGVIDVDSAAAKKWAGKNAMTDPLLADAKRDVIHAYKATNSAFSALVLQDGTIEKMWPGYSKEYLLDMNSRLADALGEKVTSFDTLYAPPSKTAGCYFE